MYVHVCAFMRIYVYLFLHEGVDCRMATKVLQNAQSSKRPYWNRGRQLIQMRRVGTRTDIRDWTRLQICWRQIELHRVANSLNCKAAPNPRSSRSHRCMTAEMGIDARGESKARYGWTVRRMNYWLIQVSYISSETELSEGPCRRHWESFVCQSLPTHCKWSDDRSVGLSPPQMLGFVLVKVSSEVSVSFVILVFGKFLGLFYFWWWLYSAHRFTCSQSTVIFTLKWSIKVCLMVGAAQVMMSSGTHKMQTHLVPALPSEWSQTLLCKMGSPRQHTAWKPWFRTKGGVTCSKA